MLLQHLEAEAEAKALQLVPGARLVPSKPSACAAAGHLEVEAEAKPLQLVATRPKGIAWGHTKGALMGQMSYQLPGSVRTASADFSHFWQRIAAGLLDVLAPYPQDNPDCSCVA